MEQQKETFQLEMTPTRELMREGYRAVVWRSWRSAAYGLMLAFCLFFAGKNIYEASYWTRQGYPEAWRDYFPHIVYFLILSAAIVVLMLLLPGRSASRYMKQLAAIHGDGGAFTVTRYFGEDGMRSHASNGGEIKTDYGQITAVYETAHTIVLRRKMSLFEVLDKSKLQGGSLEDFRAFLREKMPQAKFHWKGHA